MVKRGVLSALFLALLALSVAQAALAEIQVSPTDSKTYDKWHYDGDTFTLDGQVFLVSHLKFSDNKIILGIDGRSNVINNGSCYDAIDKRYCLQDIYTDVTNYKSGDPIKFVAGKAYAGLRIVIYKRGKDISVTRSFTPAAATRDGEVTVQLTFKNPTDFWTDSFAYEDEYVEGVYISGLSGELEKSGKKILYSKNLPPNSEKTLTYRFIVTDYVSFKNHGSATYTVSGGKKSLNTTTFSVDLSEAKPYTLTKSISNTAPETGQDFTITLSLFNKKGSTLRVDSLEITPPSQNVSLSFSQAPFTKEGGVYTWNGDILNGTTKKFDIKGRASSPGTYLLGIQVKTSDSATTSYIERTNFTIKASYKEPELILSIKEPSVAEGGNFRVAFSIKNPNQRTAFSNIYASIKSNLSTEISKLYPEILPGETKTIIINDDFLAPSVETPTNFQINASGRYRTTFDSGKQFSKTGTVLVNPVNKSIIVTQKITRPKEVHVGDNITVTVNVNHKNQELVEVSVKDTFSDGLVLGGGKSEEILHYDKAGDRQAYIYNLKVPESYEGPDLFIQSQAYIKGKPGAVTQITIIEVNQTRRIVPGSAEDNATKQESQANETSQASKPAPKPAEKEEGFFTKVVNGTIDFFRRVFGFK